MVEVAIVEHLRKEQPVTALPMVYAEYLKHHQHPFKVLVVEVEMVKVIINQDRVVKMVLLELVQLAHQVSVYLVENVPQMVVAVEMVVIGDKMVEKHLVKDHEDLREQQLTEILHFLLILTNYMEQITQTLLEVQLTSK